MGEKSVSVGAGSKGQVVAVSGGCGEDRASGITLLETSCWR